MIRKIDAQSIGALLDPVIAEIWNNPKLFTELSCPTVVLWTRYNPGQLALLAEQGARLIPNSELIVLENSAHWRRWEEPQEFNRVHIAYLKNKRTPSCNACG